MFESMPSTCATVEKFLVTLVDGPTARWTAVWTALSARPSDLHLLNFWVGNIQDAH
jgi:hypothetical protein